MDINVLTTDSNTASTVLVGLQSHERKKGLLLLYKLLFGSQTLGYKELINQKTPKSFITAFWQVPLSSYINGRLPECCLHIYHFHSVT